MYIYLHHVATLFFLTLCIFHFPVPLSHFGIGLEGDGGRMGMGQPRMGHDNVFKEVSETHLENL